MSILLVVLSPRRQGTSTLLANLLKQELGEAEGVWNLPDITKEWSSFLQAAETADTWIFTVPCYVNAIPGDALKVLELLQKEQLQGGKYVYAIAQGGMPYAHTHHCCLGNIKLFAQAMQQQWMGGLIIGGGAIVNGESLDRLPNAKQVKRCLQTMTACIRQHAAIPSQLIQKAEMKIPAFIARMLSLKMNYTIHKQQKKIGTHRHACYYIEKNEM